MRTRLLMMMAVPLLVVAGHSQDFPSAYPSTGNDNPLSLSGQTQELNCSSPTMAGSPQCMRGQSGGFPQGGATGGDSSGIESLSSQPGHVTTFSDERGTGNSTPRRTAPIPLPPERLTEFQKFVASTTGQVLPVYGANLFQNVPSTFAPLDNIPIPSTYLVGPDDELRVRVWGQVNFNANVKVDRSGDIFLPQIGTVHVAGLHFAELEQHLREDIAKIYRNFQLSAQIGQIRAVQIYITGEARRPGAYTVSSLSTLVDALFASGGPTVQGSMRRIELRRGGTSLSTIDLYRLLVKGDKSQDSTLLPGDVIYIPSVGQQVAVWGSVRRPAIYELLPDETVSAAIAHAGGITALASEARASLERTVEHSGRQAMEVRLDSAGMSAALNDGDILQVLSIVTKFQKTVTLRGNTANPGRFAWHQGMRLSELIPDRNSLITRDYWWKRTTLGLPAPEFESVPALSELRQPSSPVDLRQRQLSARAGSDNADRPANSQQGQNAATADPFSDPFRDYSDHYGDPNGNYGDAAAADANGEARPGQRPQRNAAMQGNQSALGEQENDSHEQDRVQPVRRTVVRLSVPEVDWSYAVIERMDPATLKTTLLPFDLGKLVMEHDSAQDLELAPGDVVSVFSQSDIHVPIAEQTSLVHFDGEFVHAGTYSVRPGESLRSLVERAGGLTPNAYLFGSVFTRESTRVVQQRRIDESIHEMTLQMQRGNLALASSPATTAQDLAGVSAAQSSERELIAQLQQVRANGRIVFQFKPDSRGTAGIPDITMENGDAFMIPSVPSTVNVVGAVFNQNSFLFSPESRVKSFLELAGGPNTNADRKRMAIVRANGAVVSRTAVNGAWGNEFYKLKLNPGDTIIVPDKTIKPSALRGFLDWSQIFSQLAFGAAAINVLR